MDIHDSLIVVIWPLRSQSSSEETSEDESGSDNEGTTDVTSSEEDTPPVHRAKPTKKKTTPPTSAKKKGKSPATSDLLDLDDCKFWYCFVGIVFILVCFRGCYNI